MIQYHLSLFCQYLFSIIFFYFLNNVLKTQKSEKVYVFIKYILHSRGFTNQEITRRFNQQCGCTTIHRESNANTQCNAHGPGQRFSPRAICEHNIQSVSSRNSKKVLDKIHLTYIVLKQTIAQTFAFIDTE